MGGMTLDIANVVNGCALLALAWFARTAVSAKQDLADYKLHVAENYLKKEGIVEVKADVKEVRDMVLTIAAKLGVPMKKPGGE